MRDRVRVTASTSIVDGDTWERWRWRALDLAHASAAPSTAIGRPGPVLLARDTRPSRDGAVHRVLPARWAAGYTIECAGDGWEWVYP